MGLVRPGYLSGTYHPDRYLFANYHPMDGMLMIRGTVNFPQVLQSDISFTKNKSNISFIKNKSNITFK